MKPATKKAAMFLTDNTEYWEAILAAEGMPAELKPSGDVSLSTGTERQHDLLPHMTTEEVDQIYGD